MVRRLIRIIWIWCLLWIVRTVLRWWFDLLIWDVIATFRPFNILWFVIVTSIFYFWVYLLIGAVIVIFFKIFHQILIHGFISLLYVYFHVSSVFPLGCVALTHCLLLSFLRFHGIPSLLVLLLLLLQLLNFLSPVYLTLFALLTYMTDWCVIKSTVIISIIINLIEITVQQIICILFIGILVGRTTIFVFGWRSIFQLLIKMTQIFHHFVAIVINVDVTLIFLIVY